MGKYAKKMQQALDKLQAKYQKKLDKTSHKLQRYKAYSRELEERYNPSLAEQPTLRAKYAILEEQEEKPTIAVATTPIPAAPVEVTSMLKQPLGKDKYGRLIYAGDRLYNPDRPEERYLVLGERLPATAINTELTVIDLLHESALPYTNYERYFASVCPLEEVSQLWETDKKEAEEKQDPFWDEFTALFNCDFSQWLLQTATF